MSVEKKADRAQETPVETERDDRRAVRDSLLVTIGGQIEQVAGTLTAFALRWMLDPARLGVYSGLRLYLDNTNRSSLGVSLGAAQEIPILLAAGKDDEATRVANVAYTTNTVTCLIYAVGLVVWSILRTPLLRDDPLAELWTRGLFIVAGLTLIKRYQDFLIVVLRARREFALLTRMAVLDSLLGAAGTIGGIAVAGFWGLLACVGGLLLFNIAYLHYYNSVRFQWRWEWTTIGRLMKVGLPILANTAILGAAMNLDRILILWRVPGGEKALGLYSIALMGTSWSLDLAGRIVIVMYTYFQTTLGRTNDLVETARQAARATLAQATPIAAGSAIAYVVGPVFLGLMIPKYAEGLPALRPLLPGMLLLASAWPARQFLITIDRPYRLFAATAIGLAAAWVAGTIGADRGGIVGVAWGMTIGYSCIYLLTTFTAFAPALSPRGWLELQGRLAATTVWYAASAVVAAHVPLGNPPRYLEYALRPAILAILAGPMLWRWGVRHEWGGLFRRESRNGKA